MPAAAEKVAIDCTGYRCEMDKEVDLIIAGVEKRKDVIDAFIALQGAQEQMWVEFRDEHYDFSGIDT